MGRRLDVLAATASLCVAAFLLVIWLSPVPLFLPQTTQFELVLTPQCGSEPQEKVFPSGVTVTMTWSTTAPPFSPGGVWMNASGPNGSDNWAAVYVAYFTNVHMAALDWFDQTVGGVYTFMACAVGGAPDTPVFMNGSYTVSPVF